MYRVGVVGYLPVSAFSECLVHLHGVSSLWSCHGYSDRVDRLLHLLVVAKSVPVLTRATEILLAAPTICHLVLELIDLHLVRLCIANVVFTMTDNDYKRVINYG